MVKQESSSRAAVSEMDLYNWEVALTVELGGAVYAGAGGQGANIFNQYYCSTPCRDIRSSVGYSIVIYSVTSEASLYSRSHILRICSGVQCSSASFVAGESRYGHSSSHGVVDKLILITTGRSGRGHSIPIWE